MFKSAHTQRLVSFIVAFVIVGVALPALYFASQLIDSSQNRVILTADQLKLQSVNLTETIPDVQVDLKAKMATVSSLGKAAPSFSAQAVLIQDLKSGQLLLAKNANNRLSPASTTKLMTALVAINHYKLGEILTVMPEDGVGGSSMGLHLGETVTFRGLLYGMLLNSGNDAAFTIGSNYPGGMAAFVAAMNQKAMELGLKDTNFQNPAGFDAPNHYSSAVDLAAIAREVVQNDQLARIVATKDTSVLAMDRSKEHPLHNLNQLLNEPGVIGIKTGFTEKSGENLVGLVDREDHRVLTVVLGSKDRFGETKRLMDWVYGNFVWSQ